MKQRFVLMGLLSGLFRMAIAAETSPTPDSDLRGSVQPAATYAEQMATVKSGRYDIPELLFLLQDPKATTGLKPNEERAVLNEVMIRLRRMEDAGSTLEDVLMGVASDPKRDPGVREYAVQQLLLWYSKTERKTKVEAYLWKCTEDSVVSSSAILQLHHLGMNTKEALLHPLSPVVLKALARRNLRNSDQITLLLVAAESGIADALPFARDWAESSSDRLVLQAALTAIGKLGGPADLEFVNGLESRRNLNDVRKTVEFVRKRLGAETIKGVTQ
jgi:hypothetical protein